MCLLNLLDATVADTYSSHPSRRPWKYDEDIDDRTCDTIKTIQFLRDGRIVAQVDRETQFIISEEKDGEDNK